MIPYSRHQIKLVGLDSCVDKDRFDFNKVLFLDFDGVLHPECCAKKDLFCFAPVLTSILDEVDPLRKLPIVISSLWREHCSLEQIRSYFPSRLAAQIVGVTPYMNEGEVSQVRDWTPYGGEESRTRHRQREVCMWLNEHAPHADWLAIDDREGFFHIGTPHLFLVPKVAFQGDSGITPELAPLLKERLRSFLIGEKEGTELPDPVAPSTPRCA